MRTTSPERPLGCTRDQVSPPSVEWYKAAAAPPTQMSAPIAATARKRTLPVTGTGCQVVPLSRDFSSSPPLEIVQRVAGANCSAAVAARADFAFIRGAGAELTTAAENAGTLPGGA